MLTVSLFAVLITAAIFGNFSDTVGKSDNFILPAETVTANRKCEPHNGLTKIDTEVSKRQLVFHALCGDGKKVIWKRG